jgi:transposase
LNLWLKREKETGGYQARANSAKGRKPRIQDKEKFREFVREHSERTQKQIAQF